MGDSVDRHDQRCRDILTAGGSAIAGGSGFSANVVRYGGKIAAVLRALVEASGAVGRTVVSVGERVRQLKASLDAATAARTAVAADLPWVVGVRRDLAEKLATAQVWIETNLPTMGGPINGYLVKRDPRGVINRYSWYDEDGIAVSRVDLTGKPHMVGNEPVATPHTVDVIKHVNPATGRVFANTSSRSIRPALPEEIPAP